MNDRKGKRSVSKPSMPVGTHPTPTTQSAENPPANDTPVKEASPKVFAPVDPAKGLLSAEGKSADLLPQTARPQSESKRVDVENTPTKTQDSQKIDLIKEYFHRVREEFFVFDNLRKISVSLLGDLRYLKDQLWERMQSEENSPIAMKKLVDILDDYERQINHYRTLEIWNPSDVSNNLRKTVDDLNSMLSSTTKELIDFQSQHVQFADDNNGLTSARGGIVFAKWLNLVITDLTVQTSKLDTALVEYRNSVKAEFHHMNDILDEVPVRLQELIGGQHVSAIDLDEASQIIKNHESRSTESRAKFLRLVQEKIDASTDVKPAERRLEQLRADVQEILNGLNEAILHLSQTSDLSEKSKEFPRFDIELSQGTVERSSRFQNRPEIQPQFRKVQEILDILDHQVGDPEEIAQNLKAIDEQLEEIKSRGRENLQGLKEIFKHIEGLEEEIQKNTSQEYSQALKIISSLLRKIDEGQTEESAAMREVQAALGEFNQRPRDEALKRIETFLDTLKNRPLATDYTPALKMLSDTLNEHRQKITAQLEDAKGGIEDIKSRPALNNGFTDLQDDMHTLLEVVGKQDTSIIAGHLNSLEKVLHERLVLNINHDELFIRLKAIQKLIEERPAVNQNEIFDKLSLIQKKAETIDFPGLFTDLNGISSHLHNLVNRPTVSPNDLRQMIQGVHDNLDEVKNNPLPVNTKPLLTQEHFDRAIGPVTGSIMDFTDARDQRKIILKTVQDIHHGVQESNHRPVFDIRPINGLSRQMEAYHNDDKKNYQAIEVKLKAITVDDANFGSKIKEIRNDFKEVFDYDRLQREADIAQIGQKVDSLTNIARCALVISGITALGMLGWEIMKASIRKKERERRKIRPQQAFNTTNVGKRRHARSWSPEETLGLAN